MKPTYEERRQGDFEFRLDNAAKIFPGMLSRRRSTMFRLAARIDAPVNLVLLQQAYEAMLERCPYYRVELRKGLFWYYLEYNDSIPKVEAESRYPCMYVPYKKRGVFPHRVLAYRNRIAFEVAHCLTDGTGALEFLNGLILEYLRRRGETIDSEGVLIDCRDAPDPAEYEDSFRKHYQKGIPPAERLTPALRFGGKAARPPVFHVIEGIMDSSRLKEVAGSYGVTIGEFLTALLLDISRKEMLSRGMRPRPIRISIPINLRRFFESATMRNFVLAVEPGIDPRLGEFSFEDIIQKVHHFMRTELDHRFIRRQIVRNIQGEMKLLIKIVPRVVKDIVLRRMYSVYGTRIFTLGFSNLARVSIPEQMMPFVEEYQFIPPPHDNALNATSIAFKGRTSVVFASTIAARSLESRFFSRLRQMGVGVSIRTNRR
jgi:hypothetical protein